VRGAVGDRLLFGLVLVNLVELVGPDPAFTIASFPTLSVPISSARTASVAISFTPTPPVAISARATDSRARSTAASPPPLRSSSRTSAERTPLVSEMSLVFTSSLTMSSLNTVPAAGSAIAVPLRAAKRAR
jgi:hypothetical protein